MKNKKNAKKTNKLPLVLLFEVASFMLVRGAMFQPQISNNLDTIAELQSKIDYEKQRAEEIDNMRENVNSDEYIEKIAREKLGMIRKDEIIFIDVTGKEE